MIKYWVSTVSNCKRRAKPYQTLQCTKEYLHKFWETIVWNDKSKFNQFGMMDILLINLSKHIKGWFDDNLIDVLNWKNIEKMSKRLRLKTNTSRL